MNLAQLQQQFMSSLLEPEKTAISNEIVQQGQVDNLTRLHIYQNCYRVRLRETIQTDHPMLGLYLGDTLFDEMVAGYIDRHPSQSFTLRHFANQLPLYLERSEPFKQYPAISELARFERRLLDAFDAAHAPTIGLTELSQTPPQEWPSMTIRFHPSVQLFESKWHAVECWQALKQEEAPPEGRNVESLQHWLLWRNRERITEFKGITPLEHHLIQLALLGRPFADLCDAILQHHSEEEALGIAVTTLQTWIQAEIVTRLS